MLGHDQRNEGSIDYPNLAADVGRDNQIWFAIHINAYLNEFVFHWNRRRSYSSAFERLVGIGVALAPATCADIRAMAA